MQIKRFEAASMPEALRQVKEALGPEAILLSTRTVRNPSGRPRSFFPETVEVVAAADRPPAETRRPARPLPGPAPAGGAKRSPPEPLPESPVLQRMIAAGLCPKFVGGLAAEIRGWAKEAKGERPPEAFRNYLQWKLMEAVEVAGPEGEGAKVWAFVGPTGVGKTTTLAKLAAHFSVRLRRRVTLVSIDTYRIGAVEQLKTYARILRLPLEIAPGREDLAEVLKRNRGQDLVLIDTAGRNPCHRGQLEELSHILSADSRVENHLVLSATTKDSDLDRIGRHFGLLPVRSYIFTKIDETEEFFSLFNQLLRWPLPLSYLTNGQRVPEDIEPATKGRVADLILNRIRWN